MGGNHFRFCTHENSRIEHFFEDFALGGHAKLSDLEDVLQGLQPKISRLSKNGSCQRKSSQETDTYGSLQSKRLLEVICLENRSLKGIEMFDRCLRLSDRSIDQF